MNLCLTCSKDYKLLRGNDVIWQQFVNGIMKADALSCGAVEIPIGGASIAFTATHIAEVQEIFRSEGWGEKAPVRKPIKGNSVDDEVDD